MTNIEDSHANKYNVFMSNRSSLVASDGTTLILSTFFRLHVSECPTIIQRCYKFLKFVYSKPARYSQWFHVEIHVV